MIGKSKKPLINAYECRYLQITVFGKTTHRKEHKAMQHELLLSCVKKIRYEINNELERAETNSGNTKIVFQTGLTGSTGYVLAFNQVHPYHGGYI